MAELESKEAQTEEWLSLRDAAQMLGVHPSTLRGWADRGRIASQRTAGGHRRFRRSNVEALREGSQGGDASVEVLVQSALGRMRLEMDRVDAPWMDRSDQEVQREHRDLGRRLLQQLAQSLSMTGLTETAQEAATNLGIEYAALSKRRSLSLKEALRAFLFFRDNLIGALVQMASSLEPIGSSGWLPVHRQLSLYLNEVLLALVQAYEVASE